MEHGHPVAPSHSPVLDHHPPHEPTTGDEEQHHEKKSIMTRIHDKVNKIKHNMSKRRHANDEVPAEEGSEEFDDSNEDMEVSSPHSVYDSPATSRELDGEREPLVKPEITSRELDGEREPLVKPEIVEPHGEHEPLVEPEIVEPHVLHGRDEPPVTLETGKAHVLEPPVTPETIKATTVEEEPVAPLPYGSLPGTTDADADADTNLPISVGPTPGNESSVPREFLSSLQAMSISEQREGQRRDQPSFETQPDPEDKAPVNYMSTDDEKAAVSAASTEYSADPEDKTPVNYMSTDDEEAVVSAASPEYSAGTVSGPTYTPTNTPPPSYSETQPSSEDETPVNHISSDIEKKPSYTDKEAALSIEYSAGTVAGLTPPSYSETQPGLEDETPVNHISSDMERKPSYTEKLSTTAASDKEAAVSTENSTGTVSGSTGSPRPSYSEKFSSTAFAAKDAAVSAASMVYAKVAGKEEGTHSSETRGQVVTPVSNVAGTEEDAGEKKESYTEKLSGTAFAAKDAAVTAASTWYGMVVGAGAAMMGNAVETEQDKEKLRPGEEDKALGEVISESMQKKGEEDEVVVKRIIELPEVTSREVVSDAPAEVLFDTPPAVDAVSGGYTGQGMVEKIRGAVTSLVGGRGDVTDAPAAAVEVPSGGTADAPAADSSGGGRGGVVDTPSVFVEGPGGGAGKERDSEQLAN